MSARVAEVIGDPIAQSKSPHIHGFWLERLALADDYRRVHVPAAALSGYLEMRRADPAWRGCNVTMPHKRAVVPLLDRVEPLAGRIGAVNTVVVEDRQLVGYNTDGSGFMEPLRTLADDAAPKGTAVIVGAGGAARAIGVALWAAGYALVIANRDRDRARAIADAIAGGRSCEIATPSLSQLHEAILDGGAMRPPDWTLLVNASSLGMAGAAPFAPSLAGADPALIVYDIVYAPLETPLLAAARARGMRTIDGLAMLIGQAAAAFELFFGMPAPRAHDAELRALLTA